MKPILASAGIAHNHSKNAKDPKFLREREALHTHVRTTWERLEGVHAINIDDYLDEDPPTIPMMYKTAMKVAPGALTYT